MRTNRDPDLLLVERMLAPPPVDEARRSFEYWQRRERTLPLYRRGARREAREMAVRWHDRLRAAEHARFEAGLLGRLLAALGLSGLWMRRVSLTKRTLLVLAWAFVPWKLKLVAAGVAAAWLMLVAALVAGAVVFLQLA
jgi:hypothetical protein